jgi:hypothetical protein
MGLVGVQLAGALARTPWPPTWTDDRWNSINEREQLGRIVGVGSREPDGQRDAISIHHLVILGPSLAAIGGVAASLRAPLLARTLSLAMLARDHSIAAWPPSQLSSLGCNRSQTLWPPASHAGAASTWSRGHSPTRWARAAMGIQSGGRR